MAIVFIGIRSGSKSIPDKNVEAVCGKPMFCWTLEAALRTAEIDTIVVSSDSDSYLEIASHYANVLCIKRPDNISGDDSSDEQFILHAIRCISASIYIDAQTIIVRACATSVFQTSQDYKLVVKSLENGSAQCSMAVTFAGTHYEKCLSLIPACKDGFVLEPLNLETGAMNVSNSSRQGCRPLYKRSNLIGTTYSRFMDSGKLVSFPSSAIIIPHERGVDIDSPHDLRIASLLMQSYIDSNIDIETSYPSSFLPFS
jgi:CMP-N,N'-diacetyllegionaminic acid synthase